MASASTVVSSAPKQHLQTEAKLSPKTYSRVGSTYTNERGNRKSSLFSKLKQQVGDTLLDDNEKRRASSDRGNEYPGSFASSGYPRKPHSNVDISKTACMQIWDVNSLTCIENVHQPNCYKVRDTHNSFIGEMQNHHSVHLTLFFYKHRLGS